MKIPSAVRCMLIRGGTSKGAYFLASDLPSSREERDALLLSIKGSPHPDQIDGIGGGHPLRSKVAIVAKSSDPRIDIDFLFAQVAVDKPFWKEPGQTEEKVKAIRKAEGEQAAAILGASFEGMDLGDYPLELDRSAIERLSSEIRGFAPTIILTHAKEDPFNPDHGTAYAATEKARQLAAGAGVASAFQTIRPPSLLLFEPHQPELCGFYPNTFLDITSVIEKKQAAMEVMRAQGYLRDYYAQRATQRANHARRISGDKEIKFAEAFQQITPVVLKEFR